MGYKDTELYKMLRYVMRDPIVILLKGDWRQGKTNDALLMAYLAKKWGIVDKIGTNIHTRGENAKEVDFIEETGKLKQWMHSDSSEKVFILDEALKTLYRRKAMSRLSVKIISDIMPEVSKGHTRLIVLTQIDKLDEDLLHPAFHRATWKAVKKGVMESRSKHYPFREFTDLPKSPIDYDPDRMARFIDKEVSKVADSDTLPIISQVCAMYARGLTLTSISKRTDIHKQQVKRYIQKGLKWFVDNYADKDDPEGEENVHTPNTGLSDK